MWQLFPPIRAVAWIPFFKKFRKDKYPEYEKYVSGSKNGELACDLLFLSGNDPEFDKKILHSEEAFDNFLKKKNYRAALVLSDIHLSQNRDGSLRILSKTAEKQKVVGYTPIRDLLFRKKKPWLYSKGVGGIGSELEPDYIAYSDKIIISYKVHFRISKIGNLLAKSLTGHYAPKAKMRVDYEVRIDGTYRVFVTGSLIPNQNWHFNNIDWKHDMLNITADQLKRFMEQDYPSTIAEGNYIPHEMS
jgi:hypothetical protein